MFREGEGFPGYSGDSGFKAAVQRLLMSRLKPRPTTNLVTKSLVRVLIVHQQHVQGAEAVAKADMAIAKSVPVLRSRQSRTRLNSAVNFK